MLSFNPYLHFMGNTEEAMNFYKSVFGGTFTIFSRYKEAAGGEKISEEDADKMIHVSLQIADGLTIMATDILRSMETPLVAGNNFHICINVESDKEADRVYNALVAGGKVEMPMNKTFWGAYFGMCHDKYDVQWMINSENKPA